MTIKHKIQWVTGLVMVMGMALTGGSTEWFRNHAVPGNSGKELEAVKALLLVHQPGQISYISFPVKGTLDTHVESDTKIFPFPGERVSPQNSMVN